MLSSTLRRDIVAAAALLAAGGCMIGPSAKTFGPAFGPTGAETFIERERAPAIVGELLAVDDTALVILSGGVTIVPYRAIHVARVAQMGTQVTDGETPPPHRRRRLAWAARYPQGISAELMSALLAAYGQESPSVVAP